MASIKEILIDGKSDIKLTGNPIIDAGRLFLALLLVTIIVLIPIVAVGYISSK